MVKLPGSDLKLFCRWITFFPYHVKKVRKGELRDPDTEVNCLKWKKNQQTPNPNSNKTKPKQMKREQNKNPNNKYKPSFPHCISLAIYNFKPSSIVGLLKHTTHFQVKSKETSISMSYKDIRKYLNVSSPVIMYGRTHRQQILYFKL